MTECNNLQNSEIDKIDKKQNTSNEELADKKSKISAMAGQFDFNEKAIDELRMKSMI